MFKVKQTTRRGFSLIELVLVVMVLAILAGFVIPLIGNFTPGGEKSEKQIVTETSMLAIRDAILGTATSPGAWADMGKQPALFPRKPFWLTLEYEQLSSLAPAIYAKGPFDPVTKIGWRGPYLKGSLVHDSEGEIVRDPEGNPFLRDGWNQGIEIVVPDNDVNYARLVSRGANEDRDPLDKDDPDAQNPNKNYKPGGPGKEYADDILTKIESDDDIVMFFFVGDSRQ